MAELKTQKNDEDVLAFINGIEDDQKRKDALVLLKKMEKFSGSAPSMWGTSIIGFGDYHYKYASGREANWFQIGFSPRKQALTLYLMGGAKKEKALANLGKYKTGKGCLYIRRLSDVDEAVLDQVIRDAIEHTKQ